MRWLCGKEAFGQVLCGFIKQQIGWSLHLVNRGAISETDVTQIGQLN